ncbi:MAG TPA: antibiotic biosynthesis monooxygenase [Puia sp.]
MEKLALLARLEAKPGKEQYALQLGPSTFGVFDTFGGEEGRQAHLQGPIAQTLMAKADELLATPLQIEPVTLLAVK